MVKLTKITLLSSQETCNFEIKKPEISRENLDQIVIKPGINSNLLICFEK